MAGAAAVSGPPDFEAWDNTDLMLFEAALEAEDAAGGLEMCQSVDADWYGEASKDMDAYLLTVAEGVVEEGEDVEGTEDADAGGDEEDVGGLFGDRSKSYGCSWEDEPLDDWQPEEILKRSVKKGEERYLVKWKGHGEATWELLEDLEEEGHGPMVQAFNQRRREQGLLKAEKHNNNKGGKASKKPERTPKPTLSAPTLFDPTAYWPDFMERITKKFGDAGYRVLSVYNCTNTAKATAFNGAWSAGGGRRQTVPVMLMHGTRMGCVSKIVQSGLRVPNTGPSPISVANGTAYGVGIYTSPSVGFSHGYTKGCGYMFVCCGLVGDHYSGKIREAGQHIVVFFDQDIVMPCFLVQYEHGSAFCEPQYVNCRKALSTVLNSLDSQAQLAGASPRSSLIQSLYARYQAGCARATLQDPDPRSLRSGGAEPGMPYDSSFRTLTKKQLRAAPRKAKEAYKAGLLTQLKGAAKK